jgi:oligoribonuclease
VLAEGPVIAIHQSDEALAAMDAWNTRTHTQSGLVARVRASRADYAEAERRTLEFLAPLVPPEPRRCAATASVRTGASFRG